MNPRPHHQKVQERYSDVRDERYLEEEQGRVETFTESLRRRHALRSRPPPARRRLPRRHVPGDRRAGRLRRRGRRALALGRRRRAGAHRGHRALRRRGGRAAARGRLRRRDDVGRRRAPARSRPRPARRLPRAAARRHLRALDDGRRRAVPAPRRLALALVHADAPRLLLAPHAGRDAAARGLPHRRHARPRAPRAPLLPGVAARRLRAAAGPRSRAGRCAAPGWPSAPWA